MHNDKRQSGRTTKQLIEAIKTSVERQTTIYFVVPSHMDFYAKRLLGEILKDLKMDNRKPTVEILRHGSFQIKLKRGEYDRQCNRIYGCQDNTIIFDHALQGIEHGR